jgi:prophage endopeptidase
MNRTELVLAMSATLFAAFVLGWLLRWGFSRLNQVNSVDVTEIDQLATQLHDAELALAGANNALVQKEAELEAAMEGLGMARRESAGFQDELENLRASLHQAKAPVPAPDEAVIPEPTPQAARPMAQDTEPTLEPAPATPKAKAAPRKTAAKRNTTSKKKPAAES